jgi:hypothetical protein
MKENKLGRKYANTWSPPPRIRSKGNHRFFTRMANKGVRKNAKLLIKAGEEASEGGRSNYHASVTSLLHGEVWQIIESKTLSDNSTEYQVSDGDCYTRGTSYDFNKLIEAKEFCDRLNRRTIGEVCNLDKQSDCKSDVE